MLEQAHFPGEGSVMCDFACVSVLSAAELLSDLEGAFQEKIDAAYFDTSKYLLDVLNRNYLLLEHLQAMRRYLLLGQGDFIRHLMDLLKSATHPYIIQCSI